MDSILAWSTAALAVATVVLAGFAFITSRQAKEQIGFTAQDQEIQVKVAVLDHLRRRGEATMLALQKFLANDEKVHAEILTEVRKEPGRTITKLMESPEGREGKGYELMQKQLDAVEFLAVGVRTGVYDLNVVDAVARSVLMQLWDRSHLMRTAICDGRLENREKGQPSAYEHFDWLHDKLKTLRQDSRVLLNGQLPDMPALRSSTTSGRSGNGRAKELQELQLTLSRSDDDNAP